MHGQQNIKYKKLPAYFETKTASYSFGNVGFFPGGEREKC
jgi:hypothetical protein